MLNISVLITAVYCQRDICFVGCRLFSVHMYKTKEGDGAMANVNEITTTKELENGIRKT